MRPHAPFRFLVGDPGHVGARDTKVAQLAIRVALKFGEGRLKCPILGPGKADVLEQEGVTAAPAAFSLK
jgi:hypothetical protein